jgi:hypothetical protein
MRIIAILAAYNEARFIQPVIRHLAQQGVETYLIDHSSTDGTLDLARTLTGQGLMGWETFPRAGVFVWSELLAQKERAAQQLDADWFIHSDCDEFRLPPAGWPTLAAAIADMDRQGFNAIHFNEYTFIPVLEAPDHDHDRFQETMRWYYPFAPFPNHRLNAWKRSPHPAQLQPTGGHQVEFPGRRIAPTAFRMKHYLMLNQDQAVRKYARINDAESMAKGWHGWRARPMAPTLLLPPARALLTCTRDADLLPEAPTLARHVLGDLWEGAWPSFPRDPGWWWRLRYAARCWSNRPRQPTG